VIVLSGHVQVHAVRTHGHASGTGDSPDAARTTRVVFDFARAFVGRGKLGEGPGFRVARECRLIIFEGATRIYVFSPRADRHAERSFEALGFGAARFDGRLHQAHIGGCQLRERTRELAAELEHRIILTRVCVHVAPVRADDEILGTIDRYAVGALRIGCADAAFFAGKLRERSRARVAFE
jgi:hypothetical protein